MKKEIESMAKKAVSDIASKPISRKEAIKKTGYIAVSAASMMLLLNNPTYGKNTGPGSSQSPPKQPKDSQSNSKGGGIWK